MNPPLAQNHLLQIPFRNKRRRMWQARWPPVYPPEGRKTPLPRRSSRWQTSSHCLSQRRPLPLLVPSLCRHSTARSSHIPVACPPTPIRNRPSPALLLLPRLQRRLAPLRPQSGLGNAGQRQAAWPPLRLQPRQPWSPFHRPPCPRRCPHQFRPLSPPHRRLSTLSSVLLPVTAVPLSTFPSLPLPTATVPKLLSTPTPPTATPHVDPADAAHSLDTSKSMNAAHRAAKTHRKLARMARRTKRISVDRVWEVYVRTGGDLARTRAIVEGELGNARSKAIHTKLARLARKSEVFSKDYVWDVYAKTGNVVRVGKVLKEMKEAVLKARGGKKGEGAVDIDSHIE
ncbi:hypothetical protein B0H16DRAFT_331144 [Mycena metata]|uniref:Uncharacterized protein n=1 Tax=Mycena metata TaxID=1033252 RepID=A0AAD7HME5_9AGAR|nr:hypothetical protein B0H16DRAFT_331144 [Mycena metata]